MESGNSSRSYSKEKKSNVIKLFLPATSSKYPWEQSLSSLPSWAALGESEPGAPAPNYACNYAQPIWLLPARVSALNILDDPGGATCSQQHEGKGSWALLCSRGNPKHTRACLNFTGSLLKQISRQIQGSTRMEKKNALFFFQNFS